MYRVSGVCNTYRDGNIAEKICCICNKKIGYGSPFDTSKTKSVKGKKRTFPAEVLYFHSYCYKGIL